MRAMPSHAAWFGYLSKVKKVSSMGVASYQDKAEDCVWPGSGNRSAMHAPFRQCTCNGSAEKSTPPLLSSCEVKAYRSGLNDNTTRVIEAILLSHEILNQGLHHRLCFLHAGPKNAMFLRGVS